jgi:hypothetical protein
MAATGEVMEEGNMGKSTPRVGSKWPVGGGEVDDGRVERRGGGRPPTVGEGETVRGVRGSR